MSDKQATGTLASFGHLLRRFSSATDKLNNHAAAWSSWFILGSILIAAGNALARKLFGVSWNGLLELQWLLFGGAYLLAAARTLREDHHIRVDIIRDRFSPGLRTWIDLLGHLLFLIPFAGLMTLVSIGFVARSLGFDIRLWPFSIVQYGRVEQSSNAQGLWLWPARTLILIGFVLLLLQGLSEVIKLVGRIRARNG